MRELIDTLNQLEAKRSQGPQPLNYADCHDVLVAALRDFIRVCDETRFEHLRTGFISIPEAKADVAAMQRYVVLLDELTNEHDIQFGCFCSVPK